MTPRWTWRCNEISSIGDGGRAVQCWAFARALAMGSVALAAAQSSVPLAAVPVDLELVLATDVSSSISTEELALQRQGYVAAITDRSVLRAIERGVHRKIAVAYVEWAGLHYRRAVVGWTLIRGGASARRFASRIVGAPLRTGKGTSISRAIEFAVHLLARNDFAGTRRVIDISGDGPNNVGGLVTTARDAAVAMGITINGLPIFSTSRNPGDEFGVPDIDRYYRSCVIGGPGAFVVVADTIREFTDAVRKKLLLEIAGSSSGFGRTGHVWRNSTAPGWRARFGGVPGAIAVPVTDRAFAMRPATYSYPRGCDVGEQLLERWHGQGTLYKWMD